MAVPPNMALDDAEQALSQSLSHLRELRCQYELNPMYATSVNTSENLSKEAEILMCLAELKIQYIREIVSKMGSYRDTEAIQKLANESEDYMDDATDLYEQLDRSVGTAEVMRCMGDLKRVQQKLPAARTWWTRAMDAFDAAGDATGRAHVASLLEGLKIEKENAQLLIQRLNFLTTDPSPATQDERDKLLAAFTKALAAAAKQKQEGPGGGDVPPGDLDPYSGRLPLTPSGLGHLAEALGSDPPTELELGQMRSQMSRGSSGKKEEEGSEGSISFDDLWAWWMFSDAQTHVATACRR